MGWQQYYFSNVTPQEYLLSYSFGKKCQIFIIIGFGGSNSSSSSCSSSDSSSSISSSGGGSSDISSSSSKSSNGFKLRLSIYTNRNNAGAKK
jgi:hypothetical protein